MLKKNHYIFHLRAVSLISLLFFIRGLLPSLFFNIYIVRFLYIISTFFTLFPPKKSPDFCYFLYFTFNFYIQQKKIRIFLKNIFDGVKIKSLIIKTSSILIKIL